MKWKPKLQAVTSNGLKHYTDFIKETTVPFLDKLKFALMKPATYRVILMLLVTFFKQIKSDRLTALFEKIYGN